MGVLTWKLCLSRGLLSRGDRGCVVRHGGDEDRGVVYKLMSAMVFGSLGLKMIVPQMN